MGLNTKFAAFVFLIVSSCNLVLHGLPIDGKEVYRNQTESFQFLDNTNDTNSTNGQDLIVIRTTVYEIGILTNSDDNDTASESREQVDLTFFDPETNGTSIDLSHIPIPIQTNVSGVSVTGIAPGNLGIISLPKDDDGSKNLTFTSPVLPNAVVSVHRHVSTKDANKTQEILDNVKPLINIPQLHIKGYNPYN